MNAIEKYAVALVADGAEPRADRATWRFSPFAREDDWLTARDLGVKMGRAIKDNPESFLSWYRRWAKDA